MTTQIKTPKDAKEAINLVAESANKATADAKIAVDEMVNVAAKAAENSQVILASNQKLLQDSFETWQKYTQAYVDFFLNATRQTVEQAFAFRESFDKIVVDSLKRNQALSEAEQGVAVDLVESFQTQYKATSEQAIKAFKTLSLN